ncbi:DUF4142 domain-containing protein [Marivirga salinae]|uniref:DUF4142 domain-containing protein n=1 Tax=Marivirga salinarum TaxID=3059078 RepID=A0AA51N8V3_9BACT|nr:DUF4142 domain-containing protein [Marivirga sp. BDSF4-3]WMN10834.1 DUF4142 domain-containing protein [Marivirga sp. BDSF4-3]
MNQYIKGAMLQLTLISAFLVFVSCENEENQKGSKVIAEERNDRKFDTSEENQKNAQFLVNAAEINLKEIQLGQLAQQNGQTLHVKELGKMMEEAHAKSQKDLMALAKSKTITIPSTPTEDSKETYLKLNDKSGNDFDKVYIDKMVSSHKDAIDLFEKKSQDINDSEIKTWAKVTLKELRKHLDQSIEYQEKYKNNN